MSVLDDYLTRAAERQAELRATKPSDGWLRVLTKRAVPVRFRGTARLIATDAIRWRERRKAASLSPPLRLHLGCGGEHKNGWVNVDLVGDPVEVAWNLARPLPFPDGSVHAVFHEHLLEHLSLADGLRFMRECRRVLRPNGVLRVGVPDAGRLARSYATDTAYLEHLHPGRPTAMLALQELFYWHRHCTMYDAATLELMFRDAGFDGPQQRDFGDSRLGIAPDTERRREETLYVEAIRPA